MAVLRQQVSFVKQLFLSGMIDGTEAEEMTEPIEVRVRKLQRRGAVWRPPLLFDVRDMSRTVLGKNLCAAAVVLVMLPLQMSVYAACRSSTRPVEMAVPLR